MKVRDILAFAIGLMLGRAANAIDARHAVARREWDSLHLRILRRDGIKERR